jgi:chitin disaccharide deacetylase
MIKEIIINADDYGLKSSVNKAIIDSFSMGLINSTTIMVNMPGFEEAIELAHKSGITNKTGIHLTLSEGQPVTSDILGSNLFYSGNNYGLRKYKGSLFFLSNVERILIYNEFAAQIEKAKKAGIQISHLDTHHHVDDVWSITKIILALLKTHNIPSMRILNNLNRSTKFHKIAYRNIINVLIKSNKASFSDFFGNQFEGLSLLRDNISKCDNKKLEIMVHPDYNAQGILINRLQEQEIIFNYPEDLQNIIDLHAHISVH